MIQLYAQKESDLSTFPGEDIFNRYPAVMGNLVIKALNIEASFNATGEHDAYKTAYISALTTAGFTISETYKDGGCDMDVYTKYIGNRGASVEVGPCGSNNINIWSAVAEKYLY